MVSVPGTFCALDRKRLEAPLVDVPGTSRLTKGVPPLRVRERQPTDEPRQLAILPRPDHEVPVIGYQHVRQQPRPGPLDRLCEDFREAFAQAKGVRTIY